MHLRRGAKSCERSSAPVLVHLARLLHGNGLVHHFPLALRTHSRGYRTHQNATNGPKKTEAKSFEYTTEVTRQGRNGSNDASTSLRHLHHETGEHIHRPDMSWTPTTPYMRPMNVKTGWNISHRNGSPTNASRSDSILSCVQHCALAAPPSDSSCIHTTQQRIPHLHGRSRIASIDQR